MTAHLTLTDEEARLVDGALYAAILSARRIRGALLAARLEGVARKVHAAMGTDDARPAEPLSDAEWEAYAAAIGMNPDGSAAPATTEEAGQ